MAKISIIGTEHMGVSLAVALKEMGNTIVNQEDCEVCWIAIDTPVDEEGHGDVASVYESIQDVKPQLRPGVLVIVSSQIPVGTSKEIVKLLGENLRYAYMPEHMRVGKGVSDFMNLTEVVVGVDDRSSLPELLDIFQDKILVITSVASAEMIKHATNAFLATSLCFIYDIADICEAVGADVLEVTRALRSDKRIGAAAYLDASAGFSGGHLERDLDYLQKVAKSKKIKIPVINAVIDKNLGRRKIITNKLGDVKGKKIAFWGITYKPGAPPSDSSLPAKLMKELKAKGAQIHPYDASDYDADPYKVVKGCMAIVCITPWEELRSLDFKKISKLMVEPRMFFDARNYFARIKGELEKVGFSYIGVGR